MYIRKKVYKKIVVVLFTICFFLTNVMPVRLWAQPMLALPQPGALVGLSAGFTPVILRGIEVDPISPFVFHFIVDAGDEKLSTQELQDEVQKIVRYFLAGLALPEDKLWVNLSPYEEDRIVDEVFGQTEMGRDLLAQDYILKQVTATLTHTEDKLGKIFWQRVYQKAYETFQTTNIPINTFNKVWIVPDQARVYVQDQKAVVIGSSMDILVDQDYLSMKNNLFHDPSMLEHEHRAQAEQTNALSSAVIKEVVLPELSKEINEGKNFAQLRQIYHSLILANWFKGHMRQAFLNQVYSDHNSVEGIAIDDPTSTGKIYQRYLEAFKQGVCNFMRVEYDLYVNKHIPRKYFSGGAFLNPQVIEDSSLAGKKQAGSVLSLPNILRATTSVFNPDRSRGGLFSRKISSDFKINTLKNIVSAIGLSVIFGLSQSTSFASNQYFKGNLDEQIASNTIIMNTLESESGDSESGEETITLNTEQRLLFTLFSNLGFNNVSFRLISPTEAVVVEEGQVLGFLEYEVKRSSETLYGWYRLLNLDKTKIYSSMKNEWVSYRGGSAYSQRIRFEEEQAWNFLKEIRSPFEKAYYLKQKYIPSGSEGLLADLANQFIQANRKKHGIGQGNKKEEALVTVLPSASLSSNGGGVYEVKAMADSIHIAKSPKIFSFSMPTDNIYIHHLEIMDFSGSISGEHITSQVDNLLERVQDDIDKKRTRTYSFVILGEISYVNRLKNRIMTPEEVLKEFEGPMGQRLRSRTQGYGNTLLMDHLKEAIDFTNQKINPVVPKFVGGVTDGDHDEQTWGTKPFTPEEYRDDGRHKKIYELSSLYNFSYFIVDVNSKPSPLFQFWEKEDRERKMKGLAPLFYFSQGDYAGSEKTRKSLMSRYLQEQYVCQMRVSDTTSDSSGDFFYATLGGKIVETWNRHLQKAGLSRSSDIKITNGGMVQMDPNGEILLPLADLGFVGDVVVEQHYSPQVHPLSKKPKHPINPHQQIYLIEDASGSTKEKGYFSKVKQESIKLMRMYGDQFRAITVFNEFVNSRENTGDINQLIDYQRRVIPGSGTNGYGALKHALPKILEKHQKAKESDPDVETVILLATDGLFNQGGSGDVWIRYLPEFINEGIKIHLLADGSLGAVVNNQLEKMSIPTDLRSAFVFSDKWSETRNQPIIFHASLATGGKQYAGKNVVESFKEFALDASGGLGSADFSVNPFVPDFIIIKGIGTDGNPMVKRLNIQASTEFNRISRNVVEAKYLDSDNNQVGFINNGQRYQISPIDSTSNNSVYRFEDMDIFGWQEGSADDKKGFHKVDDLGKAAAQAFAKGKDLYVWIREDGGEKLRLFTGDQLGRLVSEIGVTVSQDKKPGIQQAGASSTLVNTNKIDQTKYGGIDFKADQFNILSEGEALDYGELIDLEALMRDFNPHRVTPTVLNMVPVTSPQMILGPN